MDTSLPQEQAVEALTKVVDMGYGLSLPIRLTSHPTRAPRASPTRRPRAPRRPARTRGRVSWSEEPKNLGFSRHIQLQLLQVKMSLGSSGLVFPNVPLVPKWFRISTRWTVPLRFGRLNPKAVELGGFTGRQLACKEIASTRSPPTRSCCAHPRPSRT